jgi:hypothetical protein
MRVRQRGVARPAAGGRGGGATRSGRFRAILTVRRRALSPRRHAGPRRPPRSRGAPRAPRARRPARPGRRSHGLGANGGPRAGRHRAPAELAANRAPPQRLPAPPARSSARAAPPPPAFRVHSNQALVSRPSPARAVQPFTPRASPLRVAFPAPPLLPRAAHASAEKMARASTVLLILLALAAGARTAGERAGFATAPAIALPPRPPPGPPPGPGTDAWAGDKPSGHRGRGRERPAAAGRSSQRQPRARGWRRPPPRMPPRPHRRAPPCAPALRSRRRRAHGHLGEQRGAGSPGRCARTRGVAPPAAASPRPPPRVPAPPHVSPPLPCESQRCPSTSTPLTSTRS